MPRTPTIAEIGQLLGIKFPLPGKRGECPFRAHRREKPFAVFKKRDTGEEMFKCFSCDPPDNVGGAVSLYVKLANVSWADAYKKLRDGGLLVDDSRPRPRTERKPDIVPSYGRRVNRLGFDMGHWDKLRAMDQRAVEIFAKERHIRAGTMMTNEVVAVGSDAIGFTYRDPDDRQPCRMKVRRILEKRFWIEPKQTEDGRQALAPLYLADKLNGGKVAVITEGEVDALTLVDAGICNVVSLPDGTASASTVSIEPLDRYPIWLIAVDADKAGAEAHRTLFQRAWRNGVAVGRLLWPNPGGGVFKDANDAAQAGMSYEWFAQVVRAAAEQTVGYEVAVEVVG